MKPHKFLAGGSTSPQAGLSQQKHTESRAEPPRVSRIHCQRSAAPQNAMVTVPCRTQGNERKVGEMKRNVPPQNGLCISPLATSLPSFSEG